MGIFLKITYQSQGGLTLKAAEKNEDIKSSTYIEIQS